MRTTSGATAIPLLRLTEEQATLAGRKAANLAALARAGFPVPEGWVIPAGTEPDFEELDQLIGEGSVAVRSSAVAEDLAGASFAGMYETTPSAAASSRRAESAPSATGVRRRTRRTRVWRCSSSGWWPPRRPASPSPSTRSGRGPG